ncbi:MAG TPA: DUF6184 family natural product biosynthesis lipoprotein [Polyangiaceae bacterium]|nr:DUF6184 family natural product biosynthesis lipoprotein [Polyangiaceae bacterium]
MKTLHHLYTLALTSTGLLIACGSASQQTPVANTSVDQPTITSQNVAQKAVVERLVTARCDQEQRCTNIGPGAKFASRQVCMDQVRGSIGNELNAYNCPHGLDSNAVDRCMMAIKSEACSTPFDTLSRYDKCRTSAMCIK